MPHQKDRQAVETDRSDTGPDLAAVGMPSRWRSLAGIGLLMGATILGCAKSSDPSPDRPGPPVPGAESTLDLGIKVFDRSSLPKAVRDQTAARRAELVADHADPRTVRFKIPKATEYTERIVAKLLQGSGLDASKLEPIITQMNDSSWGRPTASLSCGVLTMDPEGIAIMRSEDEVAAIIAHELAHHIRAHSEQLAVVMKRHPGTGGGDIFSGRSPSRQEIEARLGNEREADHISLQLLANAGYDPFAAIDCLQRVQNSIDTERLYEFHRGRPSRSHPPTEERIAYMRASINQLGLKEAPRTSAGLEEVVDELANRRRSDRPEDVPAKEIFQHYSRRRQAAEN